MSQTVNMYDEFKQLIAEVSGEVMELSIMEKLDATSKILSERLPELTSNIDRLSDLYKQIETLSQSEQNHYDKLKEMVQQLQKRNGEGLEQIKQLDEKVNKLSNKLTSTGKQVEKMVEDRSRSVQENVNLEISRLKSSFDLQAEDMQKRTKILIWLNAATLLILLYVIFG
ncbi:hypothetical protein H1D32_07825 [Anaerobacillus sp. CMMVII]|uniref:hypothetical protein n=1 Tax=Anaerobacillus sp. CMMVII TaxID=2755588 RepID=UPI0021B776F0|nr:hypothetical protein [Anaerobacillus sp. CMMVII]MCT8137671.1 hypothetical protein [Anaerobacillus sp. CMMVII]